MREPSARPSLTGRGAAVAGGAFCFGVLGVALGYVALTVIAATTAAVLVGARLVASSAPQLEVARTIEPLRVERGQPARGLVAVRNGRDRRTRACSAIDSVGGRRVEVAIPALRRGQSIAVPYPVPTERRGELVVGPLLIARGDPLGLWHAQRPVGSTVTLLVHPRVHPVDLQPAGRARHLDGPTSDTAPSGTLTFHSLREYAPGDDIRRVHWRSTARTGTLMVREHVDTSLPSAVVVLDVRADRYEGDAFEEAVDVAASFVAASERRGFPVRLVTSTGAVHAVRAGQRAQALRDVLTAIQPADHGDLRRATVAVLRSRDHDAVTVIGGVLERADLAEVTTIARRFATASLVTISDGAVGEVGHWTGGIHVDAPTALGALKRWHGRAPL
jgi:uncharacterized protein (DUF58 family)